MRQAWAVLAKQKPEGMTYVSTLGPHPAKAFIVEAETAKKAENQVKQSEYARDFDILDAIKAEQLPIVISVSIRKGN